MASLESFFVILIILIIIPIPRTNETFRKVLGNNLKSNLNESDIIQQDEEKENR
jgi:hypothetical protein